MKIAIEFYGHLRSFKETSDNVIEMLINQYDDVDVFIHTWDETDHSDKTWHNPDCEKRGNKVTQEDIDFLKIKYKPKKILIEPQIKLSKEQNIIYNLKMLETPWEYRVIKNIYYTRFKVNEIRKEYQKEHSIEYKISQ